MTTNILLIIAGLALIIVIIPITAFFLQQWLILRRTSPRASTSFQGSEIAEVLYFEEKLRANYGDELPSTNIKMMLSIPNSQDKIVLLQYKKPFQNVLRCHSNGWILWRGALPTSTDDAYTYIEWQGQALRAFSESCYLATIDPENGEIISYELTEQFPKILQ